MGPRRRAPLREVFRRHPRFFWHHWGVMVPRLPEPFRFFDLVLSVGQPGFTFFERDADVLRRPRDTVSVLSTTAVGTPVRGFFHRGQCHERVGREVELQVGRDVRLTGDHPSWSVAVASADLRADLTVACLQPERVTWFARFPGYAHFAVLARLHGTIALYGQSQRVDVLCSFEHAFGRSPHELGLPRVPLDHFRYDVLALDDGRQFLATDLRVRGIPIARRGWLKAAAGGSRTTPLRLATTASESATNTAGRRVEVPKAWRATSPDGRLDLEAVRDTRLVLGLGLGHVGGFRFEGRIDGEAVGGRGYMEYATA